MNEHTEFFIKPELGIGTELWFMNNNKPSLALVAAINVHITSCTDKNKGWRDQLFGRWMNKEATTCWEFTYSYELKVSFSVEMFHLVKNKDGWYISGRKCFFSENELVQSLQKTA